MSSATTAVAVQYRLKEWAEQIRECQNRPAGMSVVDWCATHGITKANYYYRLRRVRQACLENLPPEDPAQQIVPVNTCLLQQETQAGGGIRCGKFEYYIYGRLSDIIGDIGNCETLNPA